MMRVKAFTKSEEQLEVKCRPSNEDSLVYSSVLPGGLVAFSGSWVLRQKISGTT